MSLLQRFKDWRMERIPEIERPACGNCKRPMYWHRGKQDWTCEACDNYYWYMDHDDDQYEAWEDDYCDDGDNW